MHVLNVHLHILKIHLFYAMIVFNKTSMDTNGVFVNCVPFWIKHFVVTQFTKFCFSLLPSTVPKNNEGQRYDVVLNKITDFNSKLDECWCCLWDSFARKYNIPLSKKIRMKLVANFVFLEALVCLLQFFFVWEMFFSKSKSITEKFSERQDRSVLVLKCFDCLSRVKKRKIANVEVKKHLWEFNKDWIEKWIIFSICVIILCWMNCDQVMTKIFRHVATVHLESNGKCHCCSCKIF